MVIKVLKVIAVILGLGIIWAIFVSFYNEPESFRYEKIVVEEGVDVENEP